MLLDLIQKHHSKTTELCRFKPQTNKFPVTSTNICGRITVNEICTGIPVPTKIISMHAEIIYIMNGYKLPQLSFVAVCGNVGAGKH